MITTTTITTFTNTASKFYECNKSHGYHKCWSAVSGVWTNLPVTWKLNSLHHPGNRLVMSCPDRLMTVDMLMDMDSHWNWSESWGWLMMSCPDWWQLTRWWTWTTTEIDSWGWLMMSCPDRLMTVDTLMDVDSYWNWQLGLTDDVLSRLMTVDTLMDVDSHWNWQLGLTDDVLSRLMTVDTLMDVDSHWNWQLGLTGDVLSRLTDDSWHADGCGQSLKLTAGVDWWCPVQIDRWHADGCGQSLKLTAGVDWWCPVQIDWWQLTCWWTWTVTEIDSWGWLMMSCPDWLMTVDTLMDVDSHWNWQLGLTDDVLSRLMTVDTLMDVDSHWNWQLGLTGDVLSRLTDDSWHTDGCGQSLKLTAGVEWWCPVQIDWWQLTRWWMWTVTKIDSWGWLVMSCPDWLMTVDMLMDVDSHWNWQLGLTGDVLNRLMTVDMLMDVDGHWNWQLGLTGDVLKRLMTVDMLMDMDGHWSWLLDGSRLITHWPEEVGSHWKLGSSGAVLPLSRLMTYSWMWTVTANESWGHLVIPCCLG